MMEAVAIAYVYGIDKFYDDVETMIGYRPSIFVKVCLLYITPLITAVSYTTLYVLLLVTLNGIQNAVLFLEYYGILHGSIHTINN